VRGTRNSEMKILGEPAEGLGGGQP
jgi:hypothetical protein